MEENNNEEFSNEFQSLSSIGCNQSNDIGSKVENARKNRYKNILPYDHNRIRLKEVDKGSEFDYINASLIMGLKVANDYIATQAPLENTKSDFWKMIWEQNTRNIVMLTRLVEAGKVKSTEYWPVDKNPVTLDELTLKLESETSFKHFITRNIELVKKSKKRLIRQFHFTSWPDKSVPEDPQYLIDFINFVQKSVEEEINLYGPLVVHCSAGVGRTGTFIALDQLIKTCRDQDSIDIYGTVYRLRLERTKSVQTLTQYIFIHKVMEKILQSPPTQVEENIYDLPCNIPVFNDPVYANV